MLRGLPFASLCLVVSFLPLCWLWMMSVHEMGHVLGARCSGGTVTLVELHPLTISRTDVRPNPSPLFVVWCGPVVGCVVPAVFWGIARLMKWQGEFLLRFLAAFCLVANGVYIGAGSFAFVGDAGDMLRLGSPAWLLWLFGLITVGLGLGLWNGLGSQFGIGRQAAGVRSIWVMSSFGLLVLTVLLMLLRQRFRQTGW